MTRPWIDQYDAGVPPSLTYPEIGLSELLSRAASRYPNRPAIRFYGRAISYRDLDSLATRFAAGLQALGLGRGRVVGLMLPNLPQTIIATYGSFKTGAVVTAVNPLYVEAEIAQQVTDSGCEVLVALDRFLPRIQPLLGQTPLKHVVVTGVQDYLPWIKRVLYPLKHRQEAPARRQPDPRVIPLGELLRRAGPPVGPPSAPDDLALLQYTGGTTGLPKGVMLTHRNLVVNTWQCRHWMSTLREGEEVFLGVLPFFHVYGLSACQNLAISVAATLVILPRFQTTEVLEAITREQVTVFPGIPAMYSALNHYQGLERYDLRSIRLCISGAGPLHPAVQEKFESLTGAKLVEGYGLTEAGPVTHVNPIHRPAAQRPARSIGLPLPDTDARVMDVETGTRELPIGSVGELAVRGPQVMQRYWKREEETAQVLRDGWLYTGDLARQDAAGFFYIEDRKKDMIKSGGENVYPREVEEVLLRHPKVKEAAVIGLPQGLRGELIKAYVVLKEGEQASAADVLEHCRSHLARFKVPKRVEFRAELPKTLVGKVLRRVLLDEELKKAPAGRAREGSA
jgi:long-chain acyl-CoA synthetase